jgi:plastocyanin
MDRRTFLGAAGVAGATALAGCLGGSRGSTGDHDVGMTTRRFRPATVEVPPGTTVVWRNTSSHAHTVTAVEDELPEGAPFWATGGFDSRSAAEAGWRDGTEGALYQGDTYRRTFETPGTHTYFCIPHEASGMFGSVVVSEDATAPE